MSRHTPLAACLILRLLLVIMQAEKVPFKVTPKGRKDGIAVGHGTLRKMGLIQTNVAMPSSTSTLRPGPSRAHFTFVKFTMMGLLCKPMCKVYKVLKNQKTLTSNQRKLAAGYNADHRDHPIKLRSVSDFDSDAEPEGEETFDVLAPQFQEDPHFEDDDATVGGGGGGGDLVGDDDDDDDDEEEEEEDESDEDEDEGVVGGDRGEANDESDYGDK